jgi:hypothetical protein
MVFENVRLVETIEISENDPRFAELLKCADDPQMDFVQDDHGNWSVRGTGETVRFATKTDEAA